MMRRHSANPIISRADIPDVDKHVRDVSSVFNPGAIKFQGRYFLALRVQTRGRETVLMPAYSDNGIEFEIPAELIEIKGLDRVPQKLYHVYDPRLTEIEGVVYMMFAADTNDGCRLGTACSTDLVHWELAGFGGEDDTRNGVLFPERRGGAYLRLERPNLDIPGGGPPTGSEIIVSESLDLASWRQTGSVMAGRPHYWDELIGSGPPPVKTREGWLHLYHGVATHFQSVNIYQAGVILLDLEDPGWIVSRGRDNILEPRELYELAGQVPNVVFPSGIIVEDCDSEGFALPDSRVLVYYGAADTCVGVAETTIKELLAASKD